MSKQATENQPLLSGRDWLKNLRGELCDQTERHTKLKEELDQLSPEFLNVVNLEENCPAALEEEVHSISNQNNKLEKAILKVRRRVSTKHDYLNLIRALRSAEMALREERRVLKKEKKFVMKAYDQINLQANKYQVRQEEAEQTLQENESLLEKVRKIRVKANNLRTENVIAEKVTFLKERKARLLQELREQNKYVQHQSDLDTERRMLKKEEKVYTQCNKELRKEIKRLTAKKLKQHPLEDEIKEARERSHWLFQQNASLQQQADELNGSVDTDEVLEVNLSSEQLLHQVTERTMELSKSILSQRKAEVSEVSEVSSALKQELLKERLKQTPERTALVIQQTREMNNRLSTYSERGLKERLELSESLTKKTEAETRQSLMEAEAETRQSLMEAENQRLLSGRDWLLTLRGELWDQTERHSKLREELDKLSPHFLIVVTVEEACRKAQEEVQRILNQNNKLESLILNVCREISTKQGYINLQRALKPAKKALEQENKVLKKEKEKVTKEYDQLNLQAFKYKVRQEEAEQTLQENESLLEKVRNIRVKANNLRTENIIADKISFLKERNACLLQGIREQNKAVQHQSDLDTERRRLKEEEKAYTDCNNALKREIKWFTAKKSKQHQLAYKIKEVRERSRWLFQQNASLHQQVDGFVQTDQILEVTLRSEQPLHQVTERTMKMSQSLLSQAEAEARQSLMDAETETRQSLMDAEAETRQSLMDAEAETRQSLMEAEDETTLMEACESRSPSPSLSFYSLSSCSSDEYFSE